MVPIVRIIVFWYLLLISPLPRDKICIILKSEICRLGSPECILRTRIKENTQFRV